MKPVNVVKEESREPKPMAERPNLFFPGAVKANPFPDLRDPSKFLTGLHTERCSETEGF